MCPDLSISLGAIKLRAKRIKRAENIPHLAALDKSAVEAGFANFRHARRVLTVAGDQPESETSTRSASDEDKHRSDSRITDT